MQLDVLKYSWDTQACSFLMVTNIVKYMSISKSSDYNTMTSHFIFSTFCVEEWKVEMQWVLSFPEKYFLPFLYNLCWKEIINLIYFFIHIIYQHNSKLIFMFHNPIQKCFYHEKITALLKLKSITHNWDINSRIVRWYVELFSAAINCTWLCFWNTLNMGIAETFFEGDRFCRMIISIKAYIVGFCLHFPQCPQ